MIEAPLAMPDLDAFDPATLKAMFLIQQAELLSHKSQIEHLQLLIAKLRRMQFGRSSEKIGRQIEQLELELEELEAAEPQPADVREAEPISPVSIDTVPSRRRQLPAHLPRETHTHLPKEESCAKCGGALSKLGEDVSEMLEYIPASFKVIRHVRPRLCCPGCERVVQAPAPSRPIERSIAGSGLLAHVLTAKFCDHLSDCHRFHNIHNKRVQTHPTKVKTAKPPRLRLAQVEHENHHRKEGDEVRHHPSEAVPFLR